MNLLSQAFFFGLLSIPFIAGLTLCISNKQNHKALIRWAWAILVFLSLTLSILPTRIEFQLPNQLIQTENMGVATSHSGFQVLYILAISALLLSFSIKTQVSRWQTAIAFFSYGCGVIVFTATDFFTRYLGLEFAALLVSTFVLFSNQPDKNQWNAFIRIFLTLRLAGFGMLVFIMILYTEFGTFQMDSILAGKAMEISPLLWAIFNVTPVIFIKTATVPFNQWLRNIKENPMWFFCTELLTASFGYYLLYRILPLLPQAPLVFAFLAIFTVGLESFNTFKNIQQNALLPTSFPRNSLLPVCFSLVALNAGKWILPLFLSFLFLKTAVLAVNNALAHSRWFKSALSSSLIILPVAFIAAAAIQSPATQILPKAAGLLIICYIIVLFLFRQHQPIETLSTTGAKQFQHTPKIIEHMGRGMKRIDKALIQLPKTSNQQLSKISKAFDSLHDGDLRSYLQWVTLLLFIVLISVVLF